MRVSEVMHKGVSSVQIQDSIKKVAALMKREDIGSVPVFKNERAVGFVTDRDIVVSCVANGRSVDDSISNAMSRDIISVFENDDIDKATKLMSDHQISRLLVLDQGKRPTGIISLQDISKYIKDEEVKAHLIEDIKR